MNKMKIQFMKMTYNENRRKEDKIDKQTIKLSRHITIVGNTFCYNLNNMLTKNL